MTTYLEAITPEDNDCDDFDPKDKQKAVYKWYDSRYSDEARDIYSKEWQQRIFEWHEAHQLAIANTNESLSSEEQLETLHFGDFFLAHPIAAFSLWRVLQACYALDRALCGDTEEVASWQQMAPFKYLRDSAIRLKWRAELERLKEQVKNHSLNFRKQSWEMKLYNILREIETFDHSFSALKDNFGANLVDMKFATWMIERIDEDVGKRFAMITELLKFKENELENIRPMQSQEDEVTLNPAPGYSRTATFPPSYSSPGQANLPQNNALATSARTSAAESEPTKKSVKPEGVMSSIKSGVKSIKRKVRKHKEYVKSLSHR